MKICKTVSGNGGGMDGHLQDLQCGVIMAATVIGFSGRSRVKLILRTAEKMTFQL